MTHKGTPQLDALTGLRGLAAWLVVAFHYRDALKPYVPPLAFGLAEHGALAVDLFFVMSGFIIALNYRLDFATAGLRALPRFLALRLARVYPLHIFMLLLFVLYQAAASLAHGRNEMHELGYLAESVVLIQAWSPANTLAWNVPAWSISTEMFAYLVFPMLAIAASRVLSRTAIAAALLFVLVALAVLAPMLGGLTDVARFGLLRCVLEFTAGVLVHRLWELGRLGRGGAEILQLAGMALIAAFAFGVDPAMTMPAAFCCIVYGLAVPGTRGEALLAGRVPVLLGTISYATYLCHYLIKYVVKLLLDRPGVPPELLFPTYAAVVLAASWPLYRFVEVPARRAIRRLADRLLPA